MYVLYFAFVFCFFIVTYGIYSIFYFNAASTFDMCY